MNSGMIRVWAILLVGCVVLVGCGDDYGNAPSAPSSGPTFSVMDIVVGSGAEAMNGQSVKINHEGWLYDAAASDKKGLLFDSSFDRDQTMTFVLGAGQVILGFDQGIVGMRVGGTRQLIIPPYLGYGPQGNAVIPPNSTLIFDVYLLSVQ